MKKTFLLLVAYTLICVVVHAQKNKGVSKKASFSSAIQGGLLLGNEGKYATTMATINGVRAGTWFVGLGAGIDFYGKKRTIPLFLNIRKDLVEKRRTFFVFADGGYNLPWLKDDEKTAGFNTGYDSKGGLYYGAGIGYRLSVIKTSMIGLSVGYSVKQHEESFNSDCDFCVPWKENYEYTFRRISIQLNYWFL